MHLAVSPLSARELDRQPVDFFCRCTRKRFKDALAMVSYEELKEMRNEGQELVCHYCNERYDITPEEIDTIIDNAKAKLN
jgi:molecular chaperone Hsp33